MAEVLTAELSADSEGLCQLEDLFLQLDVSEAVRRHRALCRQRVEIVRRRVFRCLQSEFGRRPADDDGEVVRRTGGGTQ
ncbi:Uncharacterised protein [Mycobacteroides abscessus subsp. abscessus]|nr:Uncharacterised protein [Mycobacteroides abscessus subsp. abscessus]